MPNLALQDFALRPKLPEVFDSSMLKDYMDCPSKFYLRHVLGLRRVGPGAAGLTWGSKWHDAMYALFEHQPISSPEARAAALQSMEPWPHEVLNDEDRNARTFGRMELSIEDYIEKYGSLDERLYHTVRREQYFNISCDLNDDCPFGGCGLDWCGKVDRLVEKVGREEIYDWDYKTSSYMRSSFFDEQKHGFQMPGYIWAVRHLVQRRVVGVIVDLVHTLKGTQSFYRQEIPYNDEEILEWVENTRRIVAEIRSRYDFYANDPEAWIKNYNHCSQYSGCQFRSVHYTPPIRDVRLRILGADFTEDRWNPEEH